MDQVKFEENLQKEELVRGNKSKRTRYDITKRILDISLCLFSLIISIPIILITCLAVIIESKGNPIYIQKRCGKNGEEFDVYKIRSMYTDAEKNGPQWADKNDSRVTKVGAFIRKTRIDELPQLFNIIKGDMSIVGPRPERLYFIEEFSKDIPNFKDRLIVKPGLTGYAQVNGGYDITPLEKLKLDLEYIEKRGIITDIKIMFMTIKVVLTGEGAR